MPNDETARTIETYGLVDNPPTRQLMSIVDMAAKLYSAPYAAVTIAGNDRPLAEFGQPLVDGEQTLAAPLTAPDGTTFGELAVAGVEGGHGPELLIDLAERILDVLELEVASREAFDLTERLAECEQLRHAFVRKVVHDLNNPLAAIAMSAELAMDQLTEQDNPIVKAMIEKASKGADRLKAMVDRLDKEGTLG